jgi:hypothetical protein
VALLLTAISSATAQGQDRTKQEAMRLLQEGLDRVEQKDFEGALARFEAAYRVFPSPKILLNIGNALGSLGREPEAADAYERFLGGIQGADEKRQVAREELERLVAKLARARVSLDPENATLSVDGRARDGKASRGFFLRPGRHEISVSASGYATKTVTIELDAGRETQVSLALDLLSAQTGRSPANGQGAATGPLAVGGARPHDPDGGAINRPRARRWTWIAGGAAVAALGGGIALGLHSHSVYSDYQHSLLKGDFDQAETEGTISIGLFTAAGALGLTSALLYLVEDRRPGAGGGARAGAILSPLPGGAALTIDGRF